MLPSFPYEITEKILRLATLDLVEEERRHSKLVGQANAFLLSASFVSHTWRNIAQSLLTKHGIVDPYRVHRFIHELERQCVLNTVHGVRVGLAASYANLGLVNYGTNLPVFNILLRRLPMLNHLELVGKNLGFARCGPDTPTGPFADARQLSAKAGANLQSIHLEATTDLSFQLLLRRRDYLKLADIVPLVKLSTHLAVFEDSMRRYPPNLTNVKILRDPTDCPPELRERSILDVVANLSALKELEVPDGWRSEAVEDACEAKGVVLTWSVKSLPYEITSKILKLGTLDLVREERRHSKLIGQANAFLLSASLVSRTWRNIAQPLLIKHGIVYPARATHYIRELERQGVLSTLRAVRVGPLPEAITLYESIFGNKQISLLAFELLRRIPSLKDLELVGKSPAFGRGAGGPNTAANHVKSLSFTSYSSLALFDLGQVFSPASLTFIESRDEQMGYFTGILDAQTWLRHVTSLHIEMFGHSMITAAFSDARQRPAESGANLQSLHLEAATDVSFEFLLQRKSLLKLADIGRLIKLATHLAVFEDSAGRCPPNLTTVKILRDPENYPPELRRGLEVTIMRVISKLPALKELEVPDSWRSDAIEQACEARGVILTWSVNCESCQNIFPSSYSY
ncbi:hypothetical protein RQP46_008009 [Phenoliferia psychrophenolica]